MILILWGRIFYKIFKRCSLPLLFNSEKYAVFFVFLLFIYFIYYLLIYLFIHYFNYNYFLLLLLLLIPLLLLLLFFCYIFCSTNTCKARAACIIVPHNDGSKASIRLSGRGRSCLAFAKSGMFGLGIASKAKLTYSTQFSIRNKTCTWNRGDGMHWYVQKKPLLGVDIWDFVNAHSFNLYVCF